MRFYVYRKGTVLFMVGGERGGGGWERKRQRERERGGVGKVTSQLHLPIGPAAAEF